MVSSSAFSFIDLLRKGFAGLLPSESLLPTVADARDDRCRAGPVLDVIKGDGEKAQTLTRKAHATATRLKIKEEVFIMVKKGWRLDEKSDECCIIIVMSLLVTGRAMYYYGSIVNYRHLLCSCATAGGDWRLIVDWAGGDA
jgi:hypothetical protein